MARLVIAGTFAEDMAQVYSEQLAERIYQLIESLLAFPELGSADYRPSICGRFGGRARKLVAGPFDILYLYDRECDEVRVEALVSQRSIR